MLIDSFLFFKELDLLEIRLNYLYPYVDQFIIIEACQSFTGKRKKFNFENNIQRYRKFLNKITYYKIHDFHKSSKDLYEYLQKIESKRLILNMMKSHKYYDKNILHWVLDSYHRECIHIPIQDICKENDFLIISDLDEIPSIKVINEIKNNQFHSFPIVCKQYEFKYYLNSLHKPNWLGSIIAPYSFLKNKSFNNLRRNSIDLEVANSGGYHFTSVGGIKVLKEKIENWGHQEFNIRLIKDNLKNNINTGRDVFYRIGEKRNQLISLESNQILDKRISEIILKYDHLILIKKKSENIFEKIHYRFIQILVYIIHIKNNLHKVPSKFLFLIKNYLQSRFKSIPIFHSKFFQN